MHKRKEGQRPREGGGQEATERKSETDIARRQVRGRGRKKARGA